MVVHVTKKGERSVYQTQPKQPKKQTQYKSWRCFRGPDRKWHAYLNEDIPRDLAGKFAYTFVEGLCEQCGHGYSELMPREGHLCEECRWDAFIDDAAMSALETGETYGLGNVKEHVTPREAGRLGLHVVRRR